MDLDGLIAQLAADGPLLADAAERAGPDTAVPATDWDVRTLVTHTGGVHRWAADIVSTAGDSFDTAAGTAVGTGPADDELLDWFREGHAALVRALREAPDDLACATFLPADSPRQFWARRQAHETAIHRADAEGTGGPVTAFPPAFAADGIDELLFGFVSRPRGRLRADPPRSLHFQATDTGREWSVRIERERVAVCSEDGVGEGDCSVQGGTSDL